MPPLEADVEPAEELGNSKGGPMKRGTKLV